MDVTVELLEQSDEEALFQFERENREHFESFGFSREDHYYDSGQFKETLKGLLEDQENDRKYTYLIKNSKGEIVGRINLFSVMRGCFNKAEIGYRTGEKHQGKGYTTKAMKLVLEEAAKTHQFHRIEAGTAPDNIGSQIVLIKNGFQFVGRCSQYIQLKGKWNDSVNFEIILD